MVKVKMCGMTNLADCERAIDLAIDYVGFVFYSRSKRYISPGDARRIAREIGKRACKVGVFVEESDDEVEAVMDSCDLDFCQVYRRSAIKNRITVHRIGDKLTTEPAPQGLILFDSYSDGFGGSGKPFDFGMLKGAPFLDRAFIAGGISEENVLDVLQLKPFGVDLASSVETYPGKKDHRKMEAFIKRVRSFTT
jgi:phosphoribosylanthranilate isomerase